MRDPGRIRRILDLIDQAWGAQPDTRLLQLLENLFPRDHRDNHCMYYIEDDTLEQALMEEYKLDT